MQELYLEIVRLYILILVKIAYKYQLIRTNILIIMYSSIELESECSLDICRCDITLYLLLMSGSIYPTEGGRQRSFVNQMAGEIT